MSDCGMTSMLRAYVDDDLGQAQSRLLEAHVARCPACADELQREAMQRVAMFELAETLCLEDERDVGAAPRPGMPAAQWWGRVMVPLGAAATMMLLVVAAPPQVRATWSDDAEGSAMTSSALAQLDRPTCEDATDDDFADDGLVCAEAMTLALASWPEDWRDDWPDEPAMCQPDDGGDLACMPD
jgi:hypothetical protein